MRWVVLIVMLYISSVCFSQKPDRFIYNSQQYSGKLTTINQPWPVVCGASFPGGENAFVNYLKENVVYPDELMEYGVSGKIIIQFSIEPDGSISNVFVRRGMSGCPECDKEAVRLLENMPKWTPAVTIKNQTVKTTYQIPVFFSESLKTEFRSYFTEYLTTRLSTTVNNAPLW